MADLVGPIQVKRGTSAQWAASGIPLLEGEIGVQIDPTTGPRIKIGDGSTLWPNLPWATPDEATIAHLEQIADLVDGAVSGSDAVTAALINQTGSATNAAVAAAVAAGGGGGTGFTDNGDGTLTLNAGFTDNGDGTLTLGG